ncbi:STE3-domain-containing protein [Epithele typhae]|uniref:STE3-domain-containing protein n=1 Tax=Epithele typhae TaxID=378194 RepID=UPI0020074219|nr:STE3-domain-containing protein [Epithele typhae]KAH9943341.1 STE3-domain-containing protein [Epithele typhae]
MTNSFLALVEVEAAFSFIAFVLVTIPVYWHLEAWNIGCLLYIFWMGTQNLINFINLVVWRDNAIDWAPVWCDITTHFVIGSSIGVCCASLVINRRLYHIASVSAVSITRADKRRNMITDLAIGLGIPVVSICLYWFYQGHRYNIYEGFGCMEAYPNTILSYFLYVAWPIPIGLVSATYCSLTLHAFFKRRRQFKELMLNNPNLSFNRYFRLMGLAATEILFSVPLSVYNIVVNLRLTPIYQWAGLDDLHFGFSRIDQIPAIVWRQIPGFESAFAYRIWITVGCGIAFFLLFGFAEEARKHYRSAFESVARRVGFTTLGRSNHSSSSFGPKSGDAEVTIPSFVQRSHVRRNSLESFSGRLSSNISIDTDHDYDEKPLPFTPIGSIPSFINTPIDHSFDLGEKKEEPTSMNPPSLPVPPQPAHTRPVHSRPSTPERSEADVPQSVRHQSFASVSFLSLHPGDDIV